jgi:hypothetical protein
MAEGEEATDAQLLALLHTVEAGLADADASLAVGGVAGHSQSPLAAAAAAEGSRGADPAADIHVPPGREANCLAGAVQRQQQIKEREDALAALKKAHEGRRGAYNKADKAKKTRLDTELLVLRRGGQLEDRQPAQKPTEAAVLARAKASPAVHGRLAHPEHPPSGRLVPFLCVSPKRMAQ